jgi:hypothetical protein
MNEWLVVLFTTVFFVLVACAVIGGSLGLWAGFHRTAGWAGRRLRRDR